MATASIEYFALPPNRWDNDARAWVSVATEEFDEEADDTEGGAGSDSEQPADGGEIEEGGGGSDLDEGGTGSDDLTSSDSSIDLAAAASASAARRDSASTSTSSSSSSSSSTTTSFSSAAAAALSFKLVNWNVWFGPLCFAERFSRLLSIVRALDPTVVCLQVRDASLTTLRVMAWHPLQSTWFTRDDCDDARWCTI